MLQFRVRSAAAAALWLVSTAGPAQTTEPTPPALPLFAQPEEAAAVADANPPAKPSEIKLLPLTAVSLVVVDEVSSKTAVTGAPVQLRLARPLYVTPELGVPAGTPVEGVVIHAAKGGMGGKSGELLLGAKAILLSESVRIPLRSFTLAPFRGKNNEGIAFGTAVAGGAVGAVASMFIVGGSAKVPAGMEAVAKTSAEATIPVALLSPLPPVPAVVAAPVPAAPVPATQPNATQGENK